MARKGRTPNTVTYIATPQNCVALKRKILASVCVYVYIYIYVYVCVLYYIVPYMHILVVHMLPSGNKMFCRKRREKASCAWQQTMKLLRRA